MNKREFLRFLPFVPAAALVPAATAKTNEPKKISAVTEPTPLPYYLGTTGNISLGVTKPHAVLSIHVNGHQFNTAHFEERSDGLYGLVFSHAKRN